MVTDATPSSLREFFDRVGDVDVSLVTINRQKPKPVQELLRNAFDAQSLDLVERSLPTQDDLLALRKDGEISAVSPLDEVMNSFLLVNGDRFQTGTKGFDDEVPAVLREMDETLFDLRGYPSSNKEKLLLILISRHIERLAYKAGTGTLRSTFQRLSRLEDELGTRTVYERIAGRTVDVHVYGVPDRVPSQLDVTVHTGTSDEYRNSWCVMFRPPGDGGAALLAHQHESNRWQGFWTYDSEMIAQVDRYIDRAF